MVKVALDVVYDVFLSYARGDRARVDELYAALEARKLRVFRDENDIEHFEGITARVRDGVARSRVLLAFYSAVYPTRPACQWELMAAFLAAQRLDDPRERVLVVNPERDERGGSVAEHIQPVELRDARIAIPSSNPGCWAELADMIAKHLEHINHLPLGGGHALVPPHFGFPLFDSPGFVGRFADLWRVHSAVCAGEATLTTGVADPGAAQLVGIGGVGKTLLAQEYALRFAAGYPGGIYWLRASNLRDTQEQDGKSAVMVNAVRSDQLRLIATQHLHPDVQNATQGQIEAFVRSKIADADGLCLWVVDDLPEGLAPVQVHEWFALHPNAKTLFTTRCTAYGSLAYQVPLAGLAPDEGLELLTRYRHPIGEDEEEAARGIVTDLAGHPLAITLAASALGNEAELRSISDYRAALALLDEDELELAAELVDELPTAHHKSIAATLLRSINQLDSEGRELLLIASLLAADPISPQLIRTILTKADQLDERAAMRRTARAVAQTTRHSLVEHLTGARDAMQVHALVSRTMRHTTKVAEHERLATLRRATAMVLSDAFRAVWTQEGDVALASIAAHARHLAQPASSVLPEEPTLTAMLLSGVGNYAFQRGEYAAARAMNERVLQISLPILSYDDPNMLISISNIARTLYAQGDPAGARALHERVLITRSRKLGDKDPRTLESMSFVAEALFTEGDLSGARALQEPALEARRRVLGDEHLSTLISISNLALTMYAQGDLAGAHTLQEEALQTSRRVLKDEHPHTLTCINNLAETLHAQGDLSGARALQQEALEASRRAVGDGHPGTLTCINNLAETLRAQGHLANARKLHVHALAERRRVLGDEHPDTIGSMSNLAEVLQAQGDLAGARALDEEAQMYRRKG
ncbi:MAG TPA: toll/interleukin-1 receptor domain-containing protein [Solirubrobacteraceae bacterium]|nr:toll/interleukin-1 receptor domain-containing protein [Solirubrobacteraceae bacterium]